MKGYLFKLATLALIPFGAIANDYAGMSPAKAGTQIAEDAEKYHDGWHGSKSSGKMILIDNAGTEASQLLKTGLLEAKGKKKKGLSYIQFDTNGTGLLTHMHRKKADQQWVWVPGLKRKMRIKANNVSGAFIGSEFAYEDLRSQYPEKYDIKLLGEEACATPEGEGNCWKLERKPNYKVTGYSKHHVWIDQAHYRVLKTDFYDKKQALMKTMATHDWKKVDGYWRAFRTEMVNHQNGRKSRMEIDTLLFTKDLKASSFKPGRGLLK